LFCLLHLPIEGRLLDHDTSLSELNVVDLMFELLGVEMDKGEFQVHVMEGANARLSYRSLSYVLR